MTWRIPATRMKMAEASSSENTSGSETIALLPRTSRRKLRVCFLFPGVRRSTTFISETTFGMALKHMGFRGRQVAHGFRKHCINNGSMKAAISNRTLKGSWRMNQPMRFVRPITARKYLDERRRMMGWAGHLAQFVQSH